MKIKHLISSIFMVSAVFIAALSVNNVYAQSAIDDSEVRYPIADLGNCKDKAACAAYCDKPKNTELCLNYAQKNNLMSDDEVKIAKNFITAGSKGPGGCKSKESCETYCNDIKHIDECVSFAEKNNLMPPQELAEAKKVQAAIARGVKPPPCGNKKQCDAYCEESEHMEECISFGAEAGFIQGKELDEARKMLAAVKRGVKPPPCRGKEACDAYCSEPENMEVCMNFAMEAGFMDEKEKADAGKMLVAIKKGVKPPSCKSKEDCDSYCGEEEHFEECINFAEAAGMMSADDAVMARKTKGKGPGDCKGKEECEAFCNNPDNQETCFKFAKDNGMISEGELKKMEEGKQMMKESLQQAPSIVIDCLNSEVGSDKMEKIKSGQLMPSKEIGDKMRICFEKMGPPPGMPGTGEGGMMPPGQTGPGGCASPEECKKYCESNPEECQKFQPGPGAINPGGQMMPEQAGPGGCKTPEECKAYCANNPEECKNFAPSVPINTQLPPLPNNTQLPPPSGDAIAPPSGQIQSPSVPVGPGGCKTPEECKVYCTNNPEACGGFAPQQPPPSPPEGQYNYPTPGIQPPPCTGDNCQYVPPVGQTQPPPPPSGSGFTPVPINSPAGQIPLEYQQPPI